MKYPFIGFDFGDGDVDYLERCSACHRREKANNSTMYLAGPSGGYNSNEVTYHTSASCAFSCCGCVYSHVMSILMSCHVMSWFVRSLLSSCDAVWWSCASIERITAPGCVYLVLLVAVSGSLFVSRRVDAFVGVALILMRLVFSVEPLNHPNQLTSPRHTCCKHPLVEHLLPFLGA